MPVIFIIASRYGVDRSNRISRVLLYILLGLLGSWHLPTPLHGAR